MTHESKPLYRKVNTRARGVGHRHGGDYRHIRNSKGEKDSDRLRGSMKARTQRGLDYTPLFKFLLASVGRPWVEVHSEAVARLDKEEPIYWLVALREDERTEVVRVGESSYFNGLYVDEAGVLQIVNPAITVESLTPSCACCTHTLNGVRFTQKAPGVT